MRLPGRASPEEERQAELEIELERIRVYCAECGEPMQREESLFTGGPIMTCNPCGRGVEP